jgi:Domain of unknown function (DUF4177)
MFVSTEERFEYRVSNTGHAWFENNDDVTNQLNGLGADGWRLVTTITHPPGDWVTVVFIRQSN